MKVSVKVIPGSKKNEILDEGCDLLGLKHFRIKTSAIAEDGKANKAVIEILAEFLGVKKRRVKILSGLTSRTKIVEVL